MYSRVIILGFWGPWLTCQAACAAAQPVPLPEAPARARPFAGVPSGKVVLRQTNRGSLVLANLPGNRFTFEVTGKKIEPGGQKVEGKEYQQTWVVDGVLLQALALPLADRLTVEDAEQVLSAHQKYENDYHVKLGLVEITAARKWLKDRSGEPALYWELKLPASAGDRPTKARKMLFASTLNGRNVILLTVTVFAKDDETKVRQLLLDTLRTLVRHEKRAVPTRPEVEAAVLGRGRVTLLNEELATRKDRKAPGAVVLRPEQLLLILRVAFELEVPQAGTLTFVFDGFAGHVVTLVGYDRKTRRFAYLDTQGKHSFLEEANNHAGVKARWDPNCVDVAFGGKGCFVVSEADLQKVLQGVLIPYDNIRFYAGTADFDKAVREYLRLRRYFPRLPELAEARLLKAGRLLAEAGENARAVNLYGACTALHPNSARALAGIAAVYARTGRTGPAINFYADAIKKLPDDKGLNEAQRRQLATAWESARSALTAKRDRAPTKR